MSTVSRDIETPIPEEMWLWPLYGKGFDNLGAKGRPIRVPVPRCGPDQLLVRNDAVGMCFSDIKIINLGPEHPRLAGRDMRRDPVVLGHEVTMTVVEVGANLRDRYRVGQRFTIQADVVYKGAAIAYGYKLPGGMAQFGLIGPEILDGDGGNYLIPVEKPTTGYAQSALTEPWACVRASYNLHYRNELKSGGTAWFIGSGAAAGEFTISEGFSAASHPARVLLTGVPKSFETLLREQAGPGAGDIEVQAREAADLVAVRAIAAELVGTVDDVVFLGTPSPEVAEAAIGALARRGVANVVGHAPMTGKTQLDVGRVHYDDWVVVGTTERDVAAGYRHGVRSKLREHGRAWFVGAAGPMGRMHVQRAIELADGPSVVVCTDVSGPRLDHLEKTFAEEARRRGLGFHCLNPSEMEPAEFDARLRELSGGKGFDDIVALVPVPAVVAGAAPHLAAAGVMNVFAGVARGVKAAIDLSRCYGSDQVRIIGSSASSIDDLREMLRETEEGMLSTNRSVAAIGGIHTVREGYEAVAKGTYPGKVVIYPQVERFPLTSVEEIGAGNGSIAAKLTDGVWSVDSENEFLSRVGRESSAAAATPRALLGKGAILTGAARGLGRHLAERLVAEGAWVTLLDINEEDVARTAFEIEGDAQRLVRYAAVDVTDERAVEAAIGAAVDAFGRLDVVVANAGILVSAEATELPVERWRQVIDVNLTGYFIVARAAARHMKAQKSGSIVQINSKSGKKGSFHNSAYSASKFGGIGLTQSLALDFAPYGIRVNSVCPGNLLDSPLWKESLFAAYAKKWGITEAAVRQKYIDQVPLKRGCRYEDVANLVVFLASESASYMTGQAINVTGGQEMR